jgi:hypothetical protein
VPLRNRVTPFGEIVAVAGRGTLMGNRGILHNEQRVVVRDWQLRRWIACRLEFRGRHRQVMTPRTWTELFFLDEAAALADGHRPCAECRHADYRAFQTAWRRVYPDQPATADAIDAVLQAERRGGQWQKRTSVAEIDGLPDGTYVVLDARAWLVQGDAILRWTPDHYAQRVARPRGADVEVLTPPSIVSALRAGYQSGVHPSAMNIARHVRVEPDNRQDDREE